VKPDPFEKFRELLKSTYQFPCTYLHKFIGKNSSLFHASVADFEKKFIGLTRTQERMSAKANHIALTYDYLAGSADEIIELTVETQKINDLIYIL
jgi:putative lipoic acid-binding regulatory protein